MATDVWVVACKQPPNLNGTTLAAQCPVSQRITVQTTLEFFQQTDPAPVDPTSLDSATVLAVFSSSFSVAVLFFLAARGVGTVLRLIRFG